MIVDPIPSYPDPSMKNDNHDEHAQQPPPSYDAVVNDGYNVPGPFLREGTARGQDVKVPYLPSPGAGYPSAGSPPRQDGGQPATVVYNYVSPTTGERIVSLLPPDHPQMICFQQGGHDTGSKFGILGVIAAILWFPIGIGLCLLDRQVYCKRCGVVLHEGLPTC